jgi:serine kinase of HPr protein (carbohydrate metabolism regulator)
LRGSCFRHHFLEALVLTALDAIFFTPLHAACVAGDSGGILLCGDSGAGKSSLAYACARRGWTLISDDAVHLAPGPSRIGVGGSNTIHLREPARALFDEIRSLGAAAMPNGKQAIQIHAPAHGLRTARRATIGACIFLERRPGRVEWRDFSSTAALAYFLKYLRPRDTRRAEQHLREFLKTAPLLLQYEHVDDAAVALESLIEVAA